MGRLVLQGVSGIIRKDWARGRNVRQLSASRTLGRVMRRAVTQRMISYANQRHPRPALLEREE